MDYEIDNNITLKLAKKLKWMKELEITNPQITNQDWIKYDKEDCLNLMNLGVEYAFCIKKHNTMSSGIRYYNFKSYTKKICYIISQNSHIEQYYGYVKPELSFDYITHIIPIYE